MNHNKRVGEIEREYNFLKSFRSFTNIMINSSYYVRIEISTAVNVKNGVFWNVTLYTVFLRSVLLSLVTAKFYPMKNGVFWDVTSCGSC
jgi:hypothetical protein